ncbi:MAG: tetratricopeptide repeat protein [Thermoleophilia bacterium]|nr:tetratricopeptide repeat protein [Thermoleophilia bacterium]
MTDAVADDLVEQARSSFEAGDFRRAHEAGQAALIKRPLDTQLLRLVGNAAMELGRDDGVELLERAVALAPEDPEAWSDLGRALVLEGRVTSAGEAFRRVIRLQPDDHDALIGIAHTAYLSGDPAAAITALRQAVERDSGDAAALRSLLAIYRREGMVQDALATARALAELRQDDVLAALDVGELALDLGLLDEASAVFGRLRANDEEPGHEVYALHALIDVELRRERWRRALDLAIDATRVDRLGTTTDVLAFVVARVFGATNRPAPDRPDVDRALAASRQEHRRMHEEGLVL